MFSQATMSPGNLPFSAPLSDWTVNSPDPDPGWVQLKGWTTVKKMGG
jgi:hypothetical protein